ncbi:MAG: DsbA family protein [Acidiferrobacterales bacterium]
MKNSKTLLYLSLVISIVANVVLVTKLYFPSLQSDVRIALQPAPLVVPADHVRGDQNARNTIIVYMDFQCPYCALLHSSLRTLMRKASVRVIYRHFPIDGHPFAFKAAEASECADEQGKFWEFGDALFGDQKNMDAGTFNKIAASIGLNMGEFESCVSSERYKQRVLAQREDGLRRRVLGTPALYINGRRFNGALSEEQLEKIVQQSGA